MTTIYTVKTFGTPSIRPYTGTSIGKAMLNAKLCKGSGSCTTADVISGTSIKVLAQVNVGEAIPAGCERVRRF